MKVIAIAVSSINGKITNGKNSKVGSWSSKEDSAFFSSMISKARLIVMGKGTYEASRSIIVLKKSKLRVVLISNPKKYSKEEMPGQLEFSNLNPKKLVQSLQKRGYREMLLVGGSKVYSSFLKQGLIDEIYLTVEPLIFGQGKPLFENGKFESKLKLIKPKRLNSKGTLLLSYKVISKY